MGQNPVLGPGPHSDDEGLLRPREVAEIFDVRTTTIARWSREGRLTPMRTVGGHRRYRRADIQNLLDGGDETEDRAMAEDAVRLYDQGWSIRQVAERFECSYGVMRRILRKRVTLRNRGGTYSTVHRGINESQ